MSLRCRVLQSGYCEITQGYKQGYHNGIDLVNKGYTLGYIVAHSSGVVVSCRRDYRTKDSTGDSYGNYVKIKHDNGYYTLYAHMAYNTVTVKNGDRVSRGQVLGYMGATGRATAGHLHWEVRTPSDVRIDPRPYLDADLPNSNKQVNVYYRVKTRENGWLDEVKNLNDYAGLGKNSIVAFMVKVDRGKVWYQAHIKGGGWLPKVTGYDTNNFENGYAGDGRVIDCVRIYYETPNDIRPYKKAKYRINNLPWQYDDERTKGQDGYAGNIGEAAYRLEIVIE